MTIKLYEIKSKKFKAIQWLGDNREGINEFAPYLISFVNDKLFITCGSCAGQVCVGDWLVRNAEGPPNTNILKYDMADFVGEYDLIDEEENNF